MTINTNRSKLTENKYKFFIITVLVTFVISKNIKGPLNNIEKMMQIIFKLMKSKRYTKVVQVRNPGELMIDFILEVKVRKRESQLNQYCMTYLSDFEDSESKLEFKTRPLLQKDLGDLVFAHPFSSNLPLESLEKTAYHSNKLYVGQDIKIFENRDNWFSWQKEVYNRFYKVNHRLKESEPRSILNLVDFYGNSGKSSFFKYLYINDKKNTAKITYRNSEQLLSTISESESKNLYIIELYHKLESEEKQYLLSIIEDLKTGLLILKRQQELVMDPPHIILSSNDPLIRRGSSNNKWEIFEIEKNKNLNSLEKENQQFAVTV